jgi:hypothetical protein
VRRLGAVRIGATAAVAALPASRTEPRRRVVRRWIGLHIVAVLLFSHLFPVRRLRTFLGRETASAGTVTPDGGEEKNSPRRRARENGRAGVKKRRGGICRGTFPAAPHLSDTLYARCHKVTWV